MSIRTHVDWRHHMVQLYAVLSIYLHAVALSSLPNTHDWIPYFKHQMVSNCIIVLVHLGTFLIDLVRYLFQINNQILLFVLLGGLHHESPYGQAALECIRIPSQQCFIKKIVYCFVTLFCVLCKHCLFAVNNYRFFSANLWKHSYNWQFRCFNVVQMPH